MNETTAPFSSSRLYIHTQIPKTAKKMYVYTGSARIFIIYSRTRPTYFMTGSNHSYTLLAMQNTLPLMNKVLSLHTIICLSSFLHLAVYGVPYTMHAVALTNALIIFLPSPLYIIHKQLTSTKNCKLKHYKLTLTLLLPSGNLLRNTRP